MNFIWYRCVNMGSHFFFHVKQWILNDDETLCHTLNDTILKYWQIFARSNTISFTITDESFCNDVTEIDLVKKEDWRRSALSRTLVWCTRSLIPDNTRTLLTLVSDSCKDQALQVNFTKSMRTTQCSCCNSRCETFRDSLSTKDDAAFFASHPGTSTNPIELHYLSNTAACLAQSFTTRHYWLSELPAQVYALIHRRAHRLRCPRNLYVATIDFSKIHKT